VRPHTRKTTTVLLEKESGTVYAENVNITYAGSVCVIATLRNMAVGLLYLVGITAITAPGSPLGVSLFKYSATYRYETRITSETAIPVLRWAKNAIILAPGSRWDFRNTRRRHGGHRGYRLRGH